jgi:hypothetical protein
VRMGNKHVLSFYINVIDATLLKQGKKYWMFLKDLITWTDVSDQVFFPEGVRHGTVFKFSKKVFQSLQP